MRYNGIHAQSILAKQLPDGSWGQFHSLSADMRKAKQPTTEQALQRLQRVC